MGTQARSIPTSQWQFKAGFTSDKPEVDEDEELNEELWEDQSFEEYYSTHESEEASQPSDLEDMEDEVNKPDIYVTKTDCQYEFKKRHCLLFIGIFLTFFRLIFSSNIFQKKNSSRNAPVTFKNYKFSKSKT